MGEWRDGSTGKWIITVNSKWIVNHGQTAFRQRWIDMQPAVPIAPVGAAEVKEVAVKSCSG
jgi:hypothetical protein